MRFVAVMAILAILASGCQEALTSSQASRIDILHEHTRLMIEADAGASAEVGMMPGKFQAADDSLEQLEIIEATLGIAAQGSIDERIAAAEERMNSLMVAWNEAAGP